MDAARSRRLRVTFQIAVGTAGFLIGLASVALTSVRTAFAFVAIVLAVLALLSGLSVALSDLQHGRLLRP